uniref:Uncharacterized protein n=1 Tax=Peronospora matthiolae TaxID=2874970 RepID=A0AAV1UQN1_9STRA
MAEGRTKVKIALNGSLVYYFDVYVGDQVGQKPTLGMNFMVPAGIRLDLADGTVCLPDEVRIKLEGRRSPYGMKIQLIDADEKYLAIPVGDSVEVSVGRGPLQSILWLTRHARWAATAMTGPGMLTYLLPNDPTDQEVIIQQGKPFEQWMPADMIPRSPGYVSVG